MRGGHPSEPGTVLKAEGSPSQAFQTGGRPRPRPQDSTPSRRSKSARAGIGRELSHDIQAMTLAVPQLPKATKRVADPRPPSTFPVATTSSIDFDGSWNRYRQISGTIQKTAKDADSATGHITSSAHLPLPGRSHRSGGRKHPRYLRPYQPRPRRRGRNPRTL